MSSHSHDPGGMSSGPRLVPYMRVSLDQNFAYQCSFNCTIGCVGDDRCTGVKIPLMAAGSVPMAPPVGFPRQSPFPAVASPTHSSSAVAVVPPNVPDQPGSSSSTKFSHISNSANDVATERVKTPVAPPVLEVNQLLLKTSKPLDPSSPDTKQYMKGWFLIFSYSCFSRYNLLDSEVSEFAQWHALNERQKTRERDIARREKVLKYKGIFIY